MPTTIERMQLLNSLIVGLAYYVAEQGTEKVHQLSRDYDERLLFGKYGLYAESPSFNGFHTATDYYKMLGTKAAEGITAAGLGADDFLVKPFELEVMKQKILSLLNLNKKGNSRNEGQQP